MHILLILVLLMVAFPMVARLLGSLVAVVFWLAVAGAIVGIVQAIFH
jgi:hypothetical protein